ncbi:thioredoxin family protein [Chloroflexota bacterium]
MRKATVNLREEALAKLEPIPLTDQQYQSVISEESLTTAIEFWSFRCEACRKMAPVVSQIAATFHDKLKVYKVDVDENPRVVSEYAVPLVPYLLILKEGRPIISFAEEWSLDQISRLPDLRETAK